MFEIDRKEFGAFVSALRREQGLTQKELAEKLFISDKAVSKWETGYSIPDTTLLVPLAEILGVTVTELLECRRSEKATLEAEEAEALVQKALHFREERPIRPDKRKNAPFFLAAVLAGGVENAVVLLLGYPAAEAAYSLGLFFLVSVLFGAYFWLFIPEKLPAYYDENRITAYSDGIFRMNLVYISFNNRNWPHIVKVGRIWTVAAMLGSPLLFGGTYFFFPAAFYHARLYGAVLVMLGGLFLPMMYAAKKYE